MCLKEKVKKELQEMQKLGMDINAPYSYMLLQKTNVKKEYVCMKAGDIADAIIEMSRIKKG